MIIPDLNNFKETDSYKATIQDLKSVDRDGINNVIDFLENNSDFFWAPASSNSKYHHAYWGGLVDHSLEVRSGLLRMKRQYSLFNVEESSCIIVGILHDICKCNIYHLNQEGATGPQRNKLLNWYSEGQVEDLVNKGMNKSFASELIDWNIKGQIGEPPEIKMAWNVVDKFPMGHGEKSVCMILDLMPMTWEEQLAIRWHMGLFDAKSEGFEYRQALKEYPLVGMVTVADYESCMVKDKWSRDNDVRQEH